MPKPQPLFWCPMLLDTTVPLPVRGYLVSVCRKRLLSVVFFDFADGFGSIDRDLLVKVGRDFGISGKLFLHIRRYQQKLHTTPCRVSTVV